MWRKQEPSFVPNYHLLYPPSSKCAIHRAHSTVLEAQIPTGCFSEASSFSVLRKKTVMTQGSEKDGEVQAWGPLKST